MRRSGNREQSWKQPFKILGALFWSVLKKLSPARRLFLLLTICLAFLSVIGFHFLFLTQEIEFVLAFVGLLILLVLVIGDHISMKRDIEIAREIQRWLVPRRAPDVPGVDIAFRHTSRKDNRRRLLRRISTCYRWPAIDRRGRCFWQGHPRGDVNGHLPGRPTSSCRCQRFTF